MVLFFYQEYTLSTPNFLTFDMCEKYAIIATWKKGSRFIEANPSVNFSLVKMNFKRIMSIKDSLGSKLHEKGPTKRWYKILQ